MRGITLDARLSVLLQLPHDVGAGQGQAALGQPGLHPLPKGRSPAPRGARGPTVYAHFPTSEHLLEPALERAVRRAATA